MDKKTFQVKSYRPEHTCSRLNDTLECIDTWIMKKYEEIFGDNRFLDAIWLEKDFKRRYGLEPSKQKLYKVRAKALHAISEHHKKSLKLLHKYANIIRATNPRTTMYARVDIELIFVYPKF